MGVSSSCSLLEGPSDFAGVPSGRVIADLYQPGSALQALASQNYLRLPRLPLPRLDDTLEQLRLSCRACAASDKELAEFERCLLNFVAGTADELQAAICVSEASHEGYPHTWLQDHSDQMHYGIRDPAPISSGSFFALEGNGTLACAKFALSFCKWTRKVLAGQLDPDPTPLDLSPMGKLFSSAKIPKRGRDELFQDATSTNIVVVSGGGLWSLDVFQGDRLLAPEALAEVLEAARTTPAKSMWESLPVLTTANRDVWAKERDAVVASAANRANLELIDKAILVIAVDKAAEKDRSARARNLLLGDASSRWWDKQQLVLDAGGSFGLSFEPSYSDGTHWGRFIDECVRDSTGAASYPYTPLPRFRNFQHAKMTELTFDLPPSTKQAIGNSMQAYNLARADVDLKVLEYDHWGKAGAKVWSVSPDASVQLAFQLAYFRLYGEVGPACETVQTRRFFTGRTELARPCTPEAKIMCEDWKDRPGTKGSFLNAAKRQSDLAQTAAAGGGIDRHLCVLEKYAALMGWDVPLFRNALFLRSKGWLMSTSNGTVPHVSLYGFAPAHPLGHGLGYVCGPSRLDICCTAFASSGRSASAFCEALRKALDDILTVFAEEEARLAWAMGAAVPAERRPPPNLLGDHGLHAKPRPARLPDSQRPRVTKICHMII